MLLLVALYGVANGLSLFNSGVFGDDWRIYSVGAAHIIDIGRQLGLPPVGYYHALVAASAHPVLVYRLVIFGAFLGAALFFNRTLIEIKEIAASDRLVISFLFALFPVNATRISIGTSQYAICYGLFFAGLWATERYAVTGKVGFRLLALLLFGLSFFTGSFLFYFLIVLLYLLYVGINRRKTVRSLVKHMAVHADYMVLPVAFFVVKGQFSAPFGVYAGYNAFGVKSIVTAAGESILPFYTSFLEPLDRAFQSMSFSVVIAGLVSSALLIRRTKITFERHEHDAALFWVGVGLFYIAVYPYNVVGKLPQLFAMESRHQLLTPLGASLMLYFGLKIVMEKVGLRRAGATCAFSLLVFLFVAFQVGTALDYQRDWYKQRALIEGFRSHQQLRENNTFYFVDESRRLNANNRLYEATDYQGLLKIAFGDARRVGEVWREDTTGIRDPDEVGRLKREAEYFYMSDYVPRAPAYKVTIKEGSYSISNDQVVWLMVLERYDRARFDKRLRRIVRLTIEPMA